MKQRLTLMRARQSSGSALGATSEADSDVIRQLENSFERWEINISQLESSVDDAPRSDTLERDFLSREEEADLREELGRLLGGEEAS
jgi:hypothetical protein